jgi:hypothetical protein
MGIDEHIAGLVGHQETPPEAPAEEQDEYVAPEEEMPYLTGEADEMSPDEDTSPRSEETPRDEDTVDTGPVDAELARLRAESTGRLGEITSLREKLRTQGDAIEHMRQIMVEREEREKEEEDYQRQREQFGDVLDDPAIQYLDQKVEDLRADQQAERERREHRIRQINKVKEERDKQYAEFQQVAQDIISTETEFKKTHPTYDAAYDFLREQRSRFYKARGFDAPTTKNLVNQEEWYLVQEARQRGKNLAQEVWNMATEFGFDPASIAKKPTGRQMPNADKIQAGVSTSNIQSAPSTAGRKPGVVTREQFFNETPYAERMKILADPDKFERLVKTGELPM